MMRWKSGDEITIWSVDAERRGVKTRVKMIRQKTGKGCANDYRPYQGGVSDDFVVKTGLFGSR